MGELHLEVRGRFEGCVFLALGPSPPGLAPEFTSRSLAGFAAVLVALGVLIRRFPSPSLSDYPAFRGGN
jgi:hypothetical protein